MKTYSERASIEADCIITVRTSRTSFSASAPHRLDVLRDILKQIDEHAAEVAERRELIVKRIEIVERKSREGDE